MIFTPHGSMDRCHAEVAVLVHEGDGGGGDEAQREGHREAHQEDHHAVESSKFVSPQGCESYDAGRAVDHGTREYTPDKHRHPEIVTRINKIFKHKYLTIID